jgi:hypothetical protein
MAKKSSILNRKTSSISRKLSALSQINNSNEGLAF